MKVHSLKPLRILRILRGGDVAPELDFDEEKHEYRLNGVRLPGITTVLGDLGLIDTTWFTDEMRDFGVLRHYVTELDDLGILHEPSVDPRLIPTLNGWREWRARERFIPTFVECRVYSAFGYATIIDRVGYFEPNPNAIVVVNLKGPADLPAYAIQLAAEQRAFEERTGLAVSRRLSVNISRDGQVKAKDHTNHDDITTFLSALAVWRWKNERMQ